MSKNGRKNEGVIQKDALTGIQGDGGKEDNPYPQDPEFQALKAAAEAGDAVSQYRLALAIGRGRPFDNDGESGAPFDMGDCPRLQDALRWLRKSADLGHGPAISMLGAVHWCGQGTERDEGEAIRLWEKGAAMGDASSQNRLGIVLMDYLDEGRRDVERAFQLIKSAADQGYVPALVNLAHCHEAGIGVPKDDAQAFRYFKEAAERGNAIAQVRAGHMLEWGTGVEADAFEAARMYRMAADQDNAHGQYQLAMLKIGGRLGDKDGEGAFKLLIRSAADGYLPAVHLVGVFHLAGVFTRRNVKKGLKCLEEAADQGFPPAAYQLGMCHDAGIGLPLDRKKGFELFLQAARQGLPEAQRAVAFRYAAGDGVEKDLAASLFWLKRSGSAESPLEGTAITEDVLAEMGKFIQQRVDFGPATSDDGDDRGSGPVPKRPEVSCDGRNGRGDERFPDSDASDRLRDMGQTRCAPEPPEPRTADEGRGAPADGLEGQSGTRDSDSPEGPGVHGTMEFHGSDPIGIGFCDRLEFTDRDDVLH